MRRAWRFLGRTLPGAVAAVAALAPAGCRRIEAAPRPAFDPETARLLQETLDDARDRLGTVGATLTVVDPSGARWDGASGSSDLARGVAMAPGLRFRVGSVTKTFTAVLVLQLAGEGRLALDQKAAELLPDLLGNHPGVTVRQLLNHTSGIPGYTESKAPDFFATENADLLKAWTPRELAAMGLGMAPAFAPGKGYRYSNTNYVLLGLIVEKASGMAYGEALRRRILEPLRMSRTTLPATPDLPADSARCYTHDGKAWVDTTRIDPSWAWAAGGAVSCADDMLAWLDALAGDGLLDRAALAEMRTFVNAQGAPARGLDAVYGLGLMTNAADGAVGHSGDFVYGGQAAVYRIGKWRFVALANASPAPGRGVANGADAVAGMAIRALQAKGRL